MTEMHVIFPSVCQSSLGHWIEISQIELFSLIKQYHIDSHVAQLENILARSRIV